nr:MAG TPA: hypothetical protein [Caudoviricetes sp.]DAT59462.1 MAG TPA: hypothetical protein [Caudoviricetes sp.]DAY93437.1 MAG TPA: hypothetical protein [Caudoviricetes sp.]
MISPNVGLIFIFQRHLFSSIGVPQSYPYFQAPWPLSWC